MIRRISMLALALVVSLSLPAAAADAPFFGTKGYVSPSTDSLLEFDAHLGFGDHIFGFVGDLIGQFGFGPAAIGADLGLSIASPDGGDTGYVAEAFNFYGKGGACLDVGIELCVGGQLTAGIAPFEINDVDEIAPVLMGMISHLRYDQYGSEHIIVAPALAASVAASIFWGQMHLAMDVVIPYADTDSLDTEYAVSWGFLAGVTLFDSLSMGAGMRVFDLVSADNADTAYALDFAFRYMLGVFSPSLMLTIPLDGDTRDVLDFSLTVGLAAIF